MCRGTPVISAGFQENMPRLRLSKPHKSFRPFFDRVEHIAIVCSRYFRWIATLILYSTARVMEEGCSFGPETIVYSSGIIFLLRIVSVTGNFNIPWVVDGSTCIYLTPGLPMIPLYEMFNELRVGDFMHESRDSHALWGSFDMSDLSLESWHEIFCRFPFSLLDMGWTDTKEFVKPVKAISTPQGISKTPDRILLELEDRINFLIKGSRPTRRSSRHIPHAYADAVNSNPRSQSHNEPLKLNPFTFRECTGPSPQPQALGTTFEARVRDYIATHSERMENFKNFIFKQREEINDRMTEMFRLLKELTTSITPEKGSSWEGKGKDIYVFPRGSFYEAIPKKKITKKDDVRGNFELPCSIWGLKHVNSLADQESDVNVMPYSTYMKHFVILDTKENKKRPFILEMPFLTMAKAAIKFDKGTITLRSGKSKISFHRIPDSPCMTEKRVKNNIEPIASTMTVNRLVLEWEEYIKLHLEMEMEFNQ
nr:hypothetical protein [Tanacetum cinerariifolium]